MPKIPESPPETTATRSPLRAWAGRHAIDVRAVTHDVIDFGQGGRHFGGQPLRCTGSETDHEELRPFDTLRARYTGDWVKAGLPFVRLRERAVGVPSGGVLASVRAGDDDHREVGDRTRVHLGDRPGVLAAGRCPLDIAGRFHPAGLAESFSYALEGTAQLHDHRGIGVGQPASQLRY